MNKLILDESKAILKEEDIVSLPAVDVGGEIKVVPEESGDIVEPEVKTNAFKDMINAAIRNEWDSISGLNSTIATFVAEQQSDEVVDILKNIVDDKTVQVGMLTKALEIVDGKDAALMNAGVEKAEQIISEPSNDLNKEVE